MKNLLKVKFLSVLFCFIFIVLANNSLFAKEITLNVLCWEGYTKYYTEGFQKLMKEKHLLDVKFNIMNLSDPQEFWDNSRMKKADLISPAHNLLKSDRWKYIKGKVALPIDLKNVPNYKNILPFLQKNDFVTSDGEVYGVPYDMGPYGLAYNAATVSAPESWAVLLTDKAKGKYTLSKDYPDCNIQTIGLIMGADYTDIYNIDKMFKKLNKADFQKNLNILAKNAFSLWAGTANPDEFNKLDYAATWGYAVGAANQKGGNWKMASPKEGTTMWVDHWAITHAVKDDPFKKKICEEWINYCLSNEVQTGAIRNWGVSPVVTDLNDKITPEEVATFRVGDNEYWKTLSLWQNQNARTQNGYNGLWGQAIKTRK